MNTKLHINLKQGVIEVEGDEAFVREIFEHFNSSLSFQQQLDAPEPPEQQPDTSPKKTKAKKATPRKPSRTGSDTLKVDKHLDLSGVNGAMSLKDYYGQFEPKSNLDRNIVFVSYLHDQMNIEQVTIEQVWSCYVFLKLKLPGNMQQSLYDTSSSKRGARLIIPSLNEISLSVQGKNWLREQQEGND